MVARPQAGRRVTAAKPQAHCIASAPATSKKKYAHRRDAAMCARRDENDAAQARRACAGEKSMIN
jgi:hypothetical protein